VNAWSSIYKIFCLLSTTLSSLLAPICMLIKFADFNGAEEIFSSSLKAQWQDINEVLIGMPLHLKSSDQAGLQGQPIFDVVGTNAFIKEHLVKKSWSNNVSIPDEYSFLGTDVDFVEEGVIVEVQFSNYPFLLNNCVRSELFFKAQTVFERKSVKALIVITKGHMFPASNSTLYYEQAQNQIEALTSHEVIEVPIRLIGLQEKMGTVEAVWSEYTNARYSRELEGRKDVSCHIEEDSRKGSRCNLSIS